jgi:hypothetical protein
MAFRERQIETATSDLDRGNYALYIIHIAYEDDLFQAGDEDFVKTPMAAIINELSELKLGANPYPLLKSSTI